MKRVTTDTQKKGGVVAQGFGGYRSRWDLSIGE
jgi:hypothetical protein